MLVGTGMLVYADRMESVADLNCDFGGEARADPARDEGNLGLVRAARKVPDEIGE